MKKKITYLIITTVFIMNFCLGDAMAQLFEKYYFETYGVSKPISMDFQDANLKDVLKIFSQQSGLNFVASEAVQDRTITVYMENVPVEDALEKLLTANGLAYELKEDSNVFIVKELGKPKIETMTKVFHLKHASVNNSKLNTEISAKLGAEEGGDKEEEFTGIKDTIERILTERGSVVEDARTNSLTVTDVIANFPIIEATIASLDVAVPQVLIEVEMLDVSKNAVDKLGVEWPESLGAIDMTLVQRATSFPFVGSKFANVSSDVATITQAGDTVTPSGWENVSWSPNNFGPAILTVVGNQLALDFLRTLTDTKYLARPRILTLSNETAEIKITTDEAIGLKTTTQAAEGASTQTSEAERVETGVSLRVTPQVNTLTEEITMFINPSVSQATTGDTFGGTQFKDPEVRETRSVVKVKDGETIVIGGLLRTDFSETTKKVPILGDIPFLGALFRHKNVTKNEDRELIVFITPHIVKDTAQKLAFSQIEMRRLEREQDLPLAKRSAVEKALADMERKIK